MTEPDLLAPEVGFTAGEGPDDLDSLTATDLAVAALAPPDLTFCSLLTGGFTLPVAVFAAFTGFLLALCFVAPAFDVSFGVFVVILALVAVFTDAVLAGLSVALAGFNVAGVFPFALVAFASIAVFTALLFLVLAAFALAAAGFATRAATLLLAADFVSFSTFVLVLLDFAAVFCSAELAFEDAFKLVIHTLSSKTRRNPVQ